VVQSRTNTQQNPEPDFYLRVATEIEALEKVLQWYEDSIRFRLPDRASWECELALNEGFVNAVQHAHKNLPKETPIELKLTITDNYLWIEIWDQGEPFDLIAELEALKQSDLEPLEHESKRGLLFMEQLTDDLQYLRSNQWQNCLRMGKKLDFSNSSFNQASS